MKKRILVSLFSSLTALHAVQISEGEFTSEASQVQAPWFTGPLLAPSAMTIPPGDCNIEPYIFATSEIGKYNNDWHSERHPTFLNNSLQISIQTGITPWFDCVFAPTIYYNHTHGAGKWGVGDLPFGFDIQLYRRDQIVTEWTTGLLFRVQEVLPIGKYRNLDPKKEGTDAGGGGSWQTNMTLVWGNVFYLGGIYFLTWRTALLYALPAPVHVKNLNTYGGGEGTNGTVYPGQNFVLDTAIEITLSQHWVFAMDIVGSWSAKTRFQGKSAVPNTAPASVQFSLAPALEYNWNSQLGLIFGCWFTVAGKNSTEFISGVAAFNYFY